LLAKLVAAAAAARFPPGFLRGNEELVVLLFKAPLLEIRLFVAAWRLLTLEIRLEDGLTGELLVLLLAVNPVLPGGSGSGLAAERTPLVVNRLEERLLLDKYVLGRVVGLIPVMNS
jgi:hypothetical protein